MPPLRLTRRQSREVDRIAIEEYGIPGIVLMENAARSAVIAIEDLLTRKRRISVLCGPGNNGGDGLAVARHLANRGHAVDVLLAAAADTFKRDAAINLRVIQRMAADGTVTLQTEAELPPTDLIIDALFGTGMDRSAAGKPLALIRQSNERSEAGDVRVVSLDLPSGLDCDTGFVTGECMRAGLTITFVTQKTGFANPASTQLLGDVRVADIGVPRAVIDRAAMLSD